VRGAAPPRHDHSLRKVKPYRGQKRRRVKPNGEGVAAKSCEPEHADARASRSWRSPAISTVVLGAQPPSARRGSLVDNPPWLRPGAHPAFDRALIPQWRRTGVLVDAHHRGVHEVQVPVEVASGIGLRLQAPPHPVEHGRPAARDGTGSTRSRQHHSGPADPPRGAPLSKIHSVVFRICRLSSEEGPVRSCYGGSSGAIGSHCAPVNS
jgi:hypothetical protein